jgi:hypothetical protein
MKLPDIFWVHKYALQNGNVCSHIAKQNEFIDGVKVVRFDVAQREFCLGVIFALLFGVIWTMAVFAITGRL